PLVEEPLESLERVRRGVVAREVRAVPRGRAGLDLEGAELGGPHELARDVAAAVPRERSRDVGLEAHLRLGCGPVGREPREALERVVGRAAPWLADRVEGADVAAQLLATLDEQLAPARDGRDVERPLLERHRAEDRKSVG